MSKLSEKVWSEDWIQCVRDCANGKWTEIEEGRGEDLASVNCGLCKKADREIDASHRIGCVVCPVYFKTGRVQCGGTPYSNWVDYFRSHPFYKSTKRVIDEESQRLASAEKQFLLDLADEMEKVSKKEKRYFLKIGNPEIAIGEGVIYVKIVDDTGKSVYSPYLVRLNKK